MQVLDSNGERSSKSQGSRATASSAIWISHSGADSEGTFLKGLGQGRSQNIAVGLRVRRGIDRGTILRAATAKGLRGKRGAAGHRAWFVVLRPVQLAPVDSDFRKVIR
jgi:hypothetical protein